jgi:hypothetical protein
MSPGIDHDRSEDAGRAVIGGKGLVELGHDPADRGFFFHQIDAVAHIGEFQGGKDPGNSTTDDQSGFFHRDVFVFEGLEKAGLGNGTLHDFLGLGGRTLLVMGVHPTILVADIGHLEQVFIEPFTFQYLAKDGLVRPGRTGRHHHLVNHPVLDILADDFLSGIGTHEQILSRHSDIRQGFGMFADLFNIDDAADI